jgi:hypothetical protein
MMCFLKKETKEEKLTAEELYSRIRDDYLELYKEAGVVIEECDGCLLFKFEDMKYEFCGNDWWSMDNLWGAVSSHMRGEIAKRMFVPFAYYHIKFLNGDLQCIAEGSFISDEPDERGYYVGVHGDKAKMDASVSRFIRKFSIRNHEQLWCQPHESNSVFVPHSTKWGTVRIPPKMFRDYKVKEDWEQL